MGEAAPRRILVIMLRRIGDVVLSTPAARALRRAFPAASIDFLAEPPAHEILEGLPFLDRVLVYGEGGRPASSLAAHARWALRLRRERYDWVVDLMGNPRSATLAALSGAAVRAGPGHVAHRWAYNRRMARSPEPCYSALEKIRMLRSIGVEADEGDWLPELRLPPGAEAGAREALARAGLPEGGPLVGLAPASRRETRRWPESSYAELGRQLRERRGARLLVFWGPGEEALAERVARGIGARAAPSPRTGSLKELAALLGLCRLVVTNCNGPKHLAVARGVPTLTIHGSSDPAAWTPPDPRHQVIREESLFCIGCRRNECPYALECLRGLDPARVAAKAASMLEPEPVSGEARR